MNYTGFIIWSFIIVLVYLLPALVASRRKHKNASAICLTNIFFGWTVLGWLVCLIWSSTANVEQVQAAK